MDELPVAPNEVENPIINSPFKEPAYHWLIRKGEHPQKVEGRRPASYFFRVPESASRGRSEQQQLSLEEDTAVGQEEDLPLVNWLRQQVKAWRDADYPGASRVTKELLQLWRADSERRAQRLFFAQVEAAETIIFIVEGPDHLKRSMPAIPVDEPGEKAKSAGFRAFIRYACKMATGSGKTTVMGMLSAWSILNRVAAPTDDRFSDTILIVCPNVTIRERLQELDPALGDLSLYRTRQLVPTHRMEELRRGEVMIANWHRLAKRELNSVNGDSAKVVKRGEPVDVVKNAGKVNETVETKYFESDRAWFKRIRQELGTSKGRSPQWLVFNDEAHHAYRRGDRDSTVSLDEAETEDRATLAKKNAKEATIWIEGLDRINKLAGGKKKGILRCVDLSATPFYIQGSGNEVGKPFPWVVSDFGLLDAIESGLVKIPQLPTGDVTGSSLASYFNIWRWVEARAAEDGLGDKVTPEIVMTYASAPITTLAQDWHARFQQWQKDAVGELHPVPPVFVVVCRDTKVAAEVYNWLADDTGNYGAAPDWFRNKPGEDVTVRVDSKVVEDLEEGGTKDETRRLRFILDTIGKKTWPGGHVPEDWSVLVRKNNEKAASDDNDGSYRWIDEKIPPGRDIRCIVSVAMLSEGWDANTVTHIVGLRPFGSQLLCEQVVGRALRRKHYTLNEETDQFEEETAKVFGVPFELVPFKVSEKNGGTGPQPDPNHIFSVPEKKAFQITFPVVEGYYAPHAVNLVVDWSRMSTLTIDPMEIPDQVQMNAMTAPDGSLAAYGPGEKGVLTLDEWRKLFRVQQVAFRLAREVVRRWNARHTDTGENGEAVPVHALFPKVAAAARRFLDEKVKCMGSSQKVDVLIAGKYAQDAVNVLYASVSQGVGTKVVELPRIPKGAASSGSTDYVDFYTRKPIRAAHKCHLNAMVADTKTWEQSAATVLDAHPGVVRWVKNEHLGFEIPYRKHGIARRYLPDFIVVLDVLINLIIEIKGQYNDDADLKAKAAERWVRAVNADGNYGAWRYLVVTDPPSLAKTLDDLCAAQVPANERLELSVDGNDEPTPW